MCRHFPLTGYGEYCPRKCKRERGEKKYKERREKREGLVPSFFLLCSFPPLPLRKKQSYPNYLHKWIVAAFEELNTHVLQHQPVNRQIMIFIGYVNHNCRPHLMLKVESLSPGGSHMGRRFLFVRRGRFSKS